MTAEKNTEVVERIIESQEEERWNQNVLRVPVLVLSQVKSRLLI